MSNDLPHFSCQDGEIFLHRQQERLNSSEQLSADKDIVSSKRKSELTDECVNNKFARATRAVPQSERRNDVAKRSDRVLDICSGPTYDSHCSYGGDYNNSEVSETFQ